MFRGLEWISKMLGRLLQRQPNLVKRHQLEFEERQQAKADAWSHGVFVDDPQNRED